jgi:hypothetical protein
MAPRAIATVASSLPPGFPQELADATLGGLQRSADRLGQGIFELSITFIGEYENFDAFCPSF